MSRISGQINHIGEDPLPMSDQAREMFIASALGNRLGIPSDDDGCEDKVKTSGRLADEALRAALSLRLSEVASRGYGAARILIINEEGARPTVDIPKAALNIVSLFTGFASEESLLSFQSDVGNQLLELGLSVYERPYEHVLRCEWITEEQEAALSAGDVESTYLAIISGVPFDDLMA